MAPIFQRGPGHAHRTQWRGKAKQGRVTEHRHRIVHTVRSSDLISHLRRPLLNDACRTVTISGKESQLQPEDMRSTQLPPTTRSIFLHVDDTLCGFCIHPPGVLREKCISCTRHLITKDWICPTTQQAMLTWTRHSTTGPMAGAQPGFALELLLSQSLDVYEICTELQCMPKLAIHRASQMVFTRIV